MKKLCIAGIVIGVLVLTGLLFLPIRAASNGTWTWNGVNYTLPNANSTILTSNDVVTVAQGGTNSTTALSQGRPIISNATQIVESSGYISKTNLSSPYAVAIGDCESIIGADASGGALEIDLPALASTNTGFRVTIINVGASGAPTVKPNSTDKIDGTNVTHTLNAQYSKMTVRSTGGATGWFVESAEDFMGSGAVSASGLHATNVNVTSLVLTPGEWDLSGTFNWSGGTSAETTLELSINDVSITQGTLGDNHAQHNLNSGLGIGTTTVPSWKYIVTAATKTVYLVATTGGGGAGTSTGAGRLSARRVR